MVSVCGPGPRDMEQGTHNDSDHCGGYRLAETPGWPWGLCTCFYPPLAWPLLAGTLTMGLDWYALLRGLSTPSEVASAASHLLCPSNVHPLCLLGASCQLQARSLALLGTLCSRTQLCLAPGVRVQQMYVEGEGEKAWPPSERGGSGAGQQGLCTPEPDLRPLNSPRPSGLEGLRGEAGLGVISPGTSFPLPMVTLKTAYASRLGSRQRPVTSLAASALNTSPAHTRALPTTLMPQRTRMRFLQTVKCHAERWLNLGSGGPLLPSTVTSCHDSRSPLSFQVPPPCAGQVWGGDACSYLPPMKTTHHLLVLLQQRA